MLELHGNRNEHFTNNNNNNTKINSKFRCVVWTGDGRVFFYNPSTRTSVWERPEDLLGRADVDKAIATTPEALIGTQLAKDDKPQVDVVMESSSSTGDSIVAVSALGSTATTRRHNTDSESSGDEGSGPKKAKLDVTAASSGMLYYFVFYKLQLNNVLMISCS